MAGGDVSVLIVDDQAPFRTVAREVVAATPGFEVVGEVESGEEAVLMASRLGPEMVLMDINMGAMSGLEATRRIVTAEPATTVVLLSTYSDRDLPDEATNCGATRYVHKEDFGPDVLMAVWDHVVARRERDP